MNASRNVDTQEPATTAPNPTPDPNPSLKEKQARAREALASLCKDGPEPPPPEKIDLVHVEDLIARNGRHHKAVSVRWNFARRLTSTEFMILSFYADNSIALDHEGRCFGFEGREKDYADYVTEARVE